MLGVGDAQVNKPYTTSALIQTIVTQDENIGAMMGKRKDRVLMGHRARGIRGRFFEELNNNWPNEGYWGTWYK